MERRQFLQVSSALALGTSLGCQSQDKEMIAKKPIGVQMYTLRDLLEKDMANTLRAAKDIGYSYAEVAGYDSGKVYGMPVKEFVTLMQDIGLTMPSSHIDHGKSQVDNTTSLLRGFEQALEDVKSMDAKYLVLAWLAEEDRQSLDDYREVAELLNRCGEMSKQYGIQMAYHNHDFELIPIDGELPYDLLLRETDPDLVKFEVDHYWFRKVDKDPYSYFKRIPGRFPLWHIKDMDNETDRDFSEVGNGVINWRSIFNMDELAGMEYFFVEQDQCKSGKPLESIKTSFQYLDELVNNERELRKKPPLQ